MYRFDPRIERIKKILAEGILGEIKNIQFTFAHPLEEKFEQTNNYRLYREAGGGALYDIGVYGLNLVNYLLDGAQVEIISVKAIKENAKDIDRSIIVLLRYDKKVMVTITASFQFLGNYLTIAGTEGSIEVSNIISQEAGELRLRKLGSKELSIDHIPAFNSYTAMIDHFDDCIMNNKQLQVTKKQTLAVIDLVEKILDIVERDT